MSNIILAAGTQDRWLSQQYPEIPKVKQLIKIDGEILIKKIQEQFPDSIVITRNGEISKHSQMVLHPANCGCTIETLFSTHGLWQTWTTVLLGDVLYGENTVHKMGVQKEQLMFYGDKGEIYAFKFHWDIIPMIHYAINALFNHKEWTPKFGKLWNLYRVLSGTDYRLHAKPGKYFTFVSDCKDFDNQEQYLKYAKNKKVRK